MPEKENVDTGTSLPIDVLVVPKITTVNGSYAWVVDAKELHSFLQPGIPYQDWIEQIIDSYGYAENIDFIIAGDNKDIYLTLPMAREISMTISTPQAKAARFCLVAFGNKDPQKEIAPQSSPQEESAVASPDTETEEEQQYQAASEETENIPDELEKLNESKETHPTQPADDEEIDEDNDLLTIVEASQELGIGVQFLYQYLDDIGWLFPGTDEPKVWTIRQGYMVYQLDEATEEGTPGLFTLEGIEVLRSKLLNLGIISFVEE